MITHFIGSTASLFLSAALKSIREDVYTLLKDSTSANKLPSSEREVHWRQMVHISQVGLCNRCDLFHC